mgnify:CR=1 FL=1
MKELLEQIKSLKFLVIGDVMLDRYVIGDVSRISPEAPVPVLTVQEKLAQEMPSLPPQVSKCLLKVLF